MSRSRFTPGLRVAMMVWEGRSVERLGHVTVLEKSGSPYISVKFDGFKTSLVVLRIALRIVKTEAGK
jgi:hypothetical protein